MAVVHKFTGEDGEKYDWEGSRFRDYGSEGASDGATVRWLIGKAEKAPTFAMRYFEIQPGGHSVAEDHPYEHGVMVVRGKAKAILGEEEQIVGPNDVVYIAPNEWHQFVNESEDEVFGFMCVIPANRRKKGKMVYAEGDLYPDEETAES